MTVKLLLKIEDLTIEEQEILLKKIDLIIHHIYKPLEKDLDYSILKHSPNWIRIESDLKEDKAFSLFKLFKELTFPHKHDDYYQIYEDPRLTLSLEYTREWMEETK